MQKRIISILLILTMLLGLAACGGDTTPTAPETTPTTAPTEGTNPTEGTTPTEGTNPTEDTTPTEGTDPTESTEPTGSQPTEHTHSYVETAACTPTCTDKGYATFTCACGDSYKGKETAALGHSWGEWATTKEPTETAEGSAERTCGTCGEKESKKLDKLVYTPPTVTAVKTEHQATGLYNSDGYAIVKKEGTVVDDNYYCNTAYILDKSGNVVFGPTDYWMYNLSYDSGVVLVETSTYWGELRIPYYLDGTPMPLDEMLPSVEMDAFFAQYEGDSAYTKIEKDIWYQVESLYNGMMTLWRRCSVNCYQGEQRVKYDLLVQSFVLSTDGKQCIELPDIFNVERGAGSGGYVYIGEVGGYSEEGLMWFWHWDKLEGSIYDLDESSFSYQEDWNNPNRLWPAGYMDMQGNIVIPAIYKSVWAFTEGLAAVKNTDGKVGFIDSQGKTVISFDYTGAYSFCDGYAAVKKDGKWGYIDKNGNTVVPFVYDDAFGASEGLMTVGNNGKYGLLDARGNTVVPLEYDDISIMEDGVAYGIKDGYVYILTLG